MNTIVLMRPILLAKDEAARLEIEDMTFVMKKRVPSWPSGRWNFRLKK